jgi:hypothetical protein
MTSSGCPDRLLWAPLQANGLPGGRTPDRARASRLTAFLCVPGRVLRSVHAVFRHRVEQNRACRRPLGSGVTVPHSPRSSSPRPPAAEGPGPAGLRGSRSARSTPTPVRAASSRPPTRHAAAWALPGRAATWALASCAWARSAPIAGTHPRAGAAPTRWPRLRLFGHAHPEPSEEAPRKMGAGRSRGRRRRPPLVEGPLLIALEAHDPVDDPLRHRQYVDRSSLTRLYRSRAACYMVGPGAPTLQ